MQKNKSAIAKEFLKAFKSAYLQIAQTLYDSRSNRPKITSKFISVIECKTRSIIYREITKRVANKRKLIDPEDELFEAVSMFHAEEQNANTGKIEFFNNEKFFAEFNTGWFGNTYEFLLSQKLKLVNDHLVFASENSNRKNSGAYYTPSEVVEYILERTLGKLISESDNVEDLLNVKIIDPASGCGQFILGTIDFVRNRYKHKLSNTRLNQLLKAFSENCLYAVDLDANAVDLCKIAVWLETGSITKNHFLCANSLIQPSFKGNKEGGFISWTEAFPDVFSENDPSFDIVLGNPPYVSFSGRQAVKLDEQASKHFKENFKIGGWLTTHSLFTELAVMHLSKRFTSFVVPSQVAHLAGYKGLRDLLEQSTEIIDIKHWGENVFPDACTPAMTFITENKKQSEKSQTKHVIWCANTDNSLLEKISQNCFNLDKLVADPGVHTGNCSKKLIKTNQSECDNCVPVLEGKQVSRFICERPIKFLDLGYVKNQDEYFTIRKLPKYESAEYVIRQTADAPIAAPRKHAVYFRNSLLALYPPAKGYDIKYIVAILNSKLMRYFYQQIVTEAHQKAFPQVKVSSLRMLPIKNIDFRNKKDQKLHDEITESVERIMISENKQAFAKLDAKIDKLIYELYALNSDEIKLIEESNK